MLVTEHELFHVLHYIEYKKERLKWLPGLRLINDNLVVGSGGLDMVEVHGRVVWVATMEERKTMLTHSGSEAMVGYSEYSAGAGLNVEELVVTHGGY
jgi:hypothetical protein